ncbi:MAG TPA: hypothetical protein VE954_42605 [Oligoflexus sp.]|uniref:hypothetical protein n=1 Tax=Oligoflexus sp. TaxID=1971216 RepID=UPI002D5DCB95|nr:hypothetical protein [Oligoflexus sp.]HYX39821.1 hypothetical protein [Oligoflexus sp.]HYX39834.1 hypothetical protein [Oligoflexus sp.]
MGKRFWLGFNVVLAALQFFVVTIWADLTAASMGIGAASNGIYSYFQRAELFKIIVATSKNETYTINYWPSIFAAIVLAGVILSSAKLWKTTTK